MEKVTLEQVEFISNDVKEKITKGETSLSVFSPLESAVNKLAIQLTEEIKIPEVSEATDNNLKELKGYRTGIRKVLKFVEESRKQVTRKLDEVKKGFIVKEKEMTNGLSELEASLKTFLEEKTEYDEKEFIKSLVPERKEKIDLVKLVFSEEELLSKPDVFNTLYQERVEEKIRKEKEYEERLQREKEIAEQARINGIEEAERKAKEEEERKKQLEVEEANKKAQEKAKLMSDENYNRFKKENNFNQETDIFVGKKLYRFVAEFED